MTENLRLELSTSTTLTSANTDLNSKSSWTPMNSTSSNDDSPWGTGTKWNDNSSITANEINTVHSYSGKKLVTVTDLDGVEQYIGNYYNWTAATAGSGTYSTTSSNASDSICPARWRLPTISDDVHSYQNLLTLAYGLVNDEASVTKFQKTPLSFIMSGRYEWFTGKKTQQGTYGIWWTSTSSTNYNAYRLHANILPNLTLGGTDIKASGFTIRCVSE